MFGLTIIREKQYNHLVSECSKLAIENVRLEKDEARHISVNRSLMGEIRVLNAKIILMDSINAELQKKARIPKAPRNRKLKRSRK